MKGSVAAIKQGYDLPLIHISYQTRLDSLLEKLFHYEKAVYSPCL
ncbi:hypothetical protein ACFPU1_16420 [Thalassorhabdus alkalitolerans]|uniref:Uncharacterized protein n=1 Tax=Thalassorhabdus alkalitolerans TaxID=2282697 RepID=A0ABW0YRD4_9BACI